MKRLLLTFLLLQVVLVNAQDYQFLGDFTSNGTPLYLEPTGDIVDVATQEMISESLPESYPVPDYNPHYISSGYDTDVILDQAAEVWVTFVSEGAGYKNVLGFYTYDLNNPSPTAPQANEITIIFPNVSALGSGGGLLMGDKVKIGTFSAGTGIGWVLLANGWSSSQSQVTSGLWQLYSNIDYNPESQEDLRYHNVLLMDPDSERIILGFEDIRRDNASCDNDFNDAIFYVTANPYEAMRTTNYADVDSATDVTSANDGGLESNGNLAELIAERNFKRSKKGDAINKKNLQSKFGKNVNTFNRTGERFLADYIPETGMYGTETAYVSSPIDLLDITNATEVFSVDFYENDIRVAAVLATETISSIYDHSKVICDRLNGSSLEDVRTVMVRGYKIMSSIILRATGEREYSISFSIKQEEQQNELFSFWNIAQYPEGNYYNFQIWGSSFSQVFAIANHVLDTLALEKPLNSTSIDDIVPLVFVKSGYYANEQLVLDIINKTNATNMVFEANISPTETSETYNIVENILLNGKWNQTVNITTGSLFDIGFSLSISDSSQQDGLYLADGPWGIDFLADYVTIDDFTVTNQSVNYVESEYQIERQPTVSGLVKGNVNLFRHLLPGNQTLDITAYNTISFNALNNQPIEVILMQEGLENWENRLRFTIPVNTIETNYTVTFDDFKDANGTNYSIYDVKTVVFSVIGDYTSFIPFSMHINHVAFKNTTALNIKDVVQHQLINYPNPFTTNTVIKLPNYTEYVSIKVIDMLGRIIDQQNINTQYGNRVNYKAPKLINGIYKYMLVTEEGLKYNGTFLIN